MVRPAGHGGGVPVLRTAVTHVAGGEDAHLVVDGGEGEVGEEHHQQGEYEDRASLVVGGRASRPQGGPDEGRQRLGGHDHARLKSCEAQEAQEEGEEGQEGGPGGRQEDVEGVAGRGGPQQVDRSLHAGHGAGGRHPGPDPRSQ